MNKSTDKLTSSGSKVIKKKNKFEASNSLWNYTLSPGWAPQEVEILKIALMKFGVGKWTAIQK
jgi:hypothetical protein